MRVKPSFRGWQRLFATASGCSLLLLSPSLLAAEVTTGAEVKAPVPDASCRSWQAQDAERPDLRVGDIRIVTGDIFDPEQDKENRWYNRVANRVHIKTRDEVVARRLLFKTGDPLNMRILAESERLLRAYNFIQDARVQVEQICGQQAHISVQTTDNWTLTPGLSFGRSGGNNSGGVNLEEHNLFGWGKSVSLEYKQDSQRTQTSLSYKDPQFLGTEQHLNLMTRSNSDGEGYQLGLNQPFQHFDSREAWGLEMATNKQETPVYAEGEIVHNIGEDTQSANLFYGWSAGRHLDHTHRYQIGWRYDRRRYFATDTQTETPVTDRLSYPWFGYEMVQDNYAQRENFRTMGKTEDIALGYQFKANAGFISKQLGADANYLKLGTHYSRGFSAPKHLGLLALDVDAYLGNGIHQGARTTLNGEWNHFIGENGSWHLNGAFTLADNLQPGEQVLLGGDNGLRGYPTGFQTGDKSVHFSAERRFYFNWYPLQMAKIGAAVFADAGTAWGQGKDVEWLGDAGVGLRIVPTRSSSGKVLHIDLAMPFNAQGKVDNYQVLVGTQVGF